MPGKLTTHVLDTAHGCPAAGMQIELWSLSHGKPRLVKSIRTNADGRADQPLLAADEMTEGLFELVFSVGDYFAGKGSSLPDVLKVLPSFRDRKSTRLNSSHLGSSYAVFCLKKKIRRSRSPRETK